jgi:hypothetical protein
MAGRGWVMPLQRRFSLVMVLLLSAIGIIGYAGGIIGVWILIS